MPLAFAWARSNWNRCVAVDIVLMCSTLALRRPANGTRVNPYLRSLPLMDPWVLYPLLLMPDVPHFALECTLILYQSPIALGLASTLANLSMS